MPNKVSKRVIKKSPRSKSPRSKSPRSKSPRSKSPSSKSPSSKSPSSKSPSSKSPSSKSISKRVLKVAGDNAENTPKISARPPKTFQIASNLDMIYFRKELGKKGWENIENTNATPTFVHYDGDKDLVIKYIGENYYKPAIIKNKTITNYTLKCDLWNIKHMRKYIKKSAIVSSAEQLRKEMKHLVYPIILKPSMRFKGYGIYVANNERDLVNAWNRIQRKFKGNPIISEYIANPVLYKGRKFHFRIYWLVDTLRRSWLYNTGFVFTALEPYVRGDWDNKLIHDSHFSTTPAKTPTIKDLLRKGNSSISLTRACIINQMKTILLRLMEEAKISTFSDVEYAYDLHGVDFMIDETKKMWLLEVNKNSLYWKKMPKTIIDGLVNLVDSYIEKKTPALRHFTRLT